MRAARPLGGTGRDRFGHGGESVGAQPRRELALDARHQPRTLVDEPGVELHRARSRPNLRIRVGAAADPGWAHLIRTLRSPARAVHDLGERVIVRAHGACVGAGIEVSAAAARLVAAPGASFRLPEVSMGLVPGAGGTASIPRRIGRQRACWMAITGDDIDLETALAWGLVDAVEPGP